MNRHTFSIFSKEGYINELIFPENICTLFYFEDLEEEIKWYMGFNLIG
jgi:hypothetical protein